MNYYTRGPISDLLGIEPSLPLGDCHSVLIGPLARSFLGAKDLCGGPVAARAVHLGILDRIQSPSGFLWRV
jgi:hypothetical protein